eukprot:3091146-Pyramimonas_sp.AAC.1
MFIICIILCIVAIDTKASSTSLRRSRYTQQRTTGIGKVAPLSYRRGTADTAKRGPSIKFVTSIDRSGSTDRQGPRWSL